ncbi:MAG: 16S rRNA (uracil(1498)-N(3))-methyltransferase [Ruminococcaceae bacterium]|nr:16S rRNA (uracil(1498)-N(3))-methyltransferase [Oscillospiraceae bacterium]
MSSTPRFFISKSEFRGDKVTITGTDANHIYRVLRLREGDGITVCDMQKNVYDGILTFVSADCAEAALSNCRLSPAEPPYEITLYQGMPKGDKPDTIVQKAVELGVTRVVPVMCERAVSRPDEKSMDKKIIRLNRIAAEAAKQCGRGIVPQVMPAISYKQMTDELCTADLSFICYEGDGVLPLREIIEKAESFKSVAFYIGPEGGISAGEIELAKQRKIPLAGLGKRILRTETAPLFVLSALSVLAERD